MRTPTYNPGTVTTDATLKALSNEAGNVENKPMKKKSRPKFSKVQTTFFTPVTIARKPVGLWICDDCPTKGGGMQELFEHSESTKHHSFTER
jgi:hypothetical protein